MPVKIGRDRQKRSLHHVHEQGSPAPEAKRQENHVLGKAHGMEGQQIPGKRDSTFEKPGTDRKLQL